MKKKNLWTVYGVWGLVSCAQSPEESTLSKGDKDDDQDQAAVSTGSSDTQGEQIKYPKLSEKGEAAVKALMALLPKLTENQVRGILHNDDWRFLYAMIEAEYGKKRTFPADITPKERMAGRLLVENAADEVYSYALTNLTGVWGEIGTCFGVAYLLEDYKGANYFMGVQSHEEVPRNKINRFIDIVGKGDRLNTHVVAEREVLRKARGAGKFSAEAASITKESLKNAPAPTTLPAATEATEKLLNGTAHIYRYAKNAKKLQKAYTDRVKQIGGRDQVFSHDNMAVQYGGVFDGVQTLDDKKVGTIPAPKRYHEFFTKDISRPVLAQYVRLKKVIDGVIEKRDALVEVYKNTTSDAAALIAAMKELKEVLKDGSLQKEHASYTSSFEGSNLAKQLAGGRTNLDIRSQLEANVQVVDQLLLGYAAMKKK